MKKYYKFLDYIISLSFPVSIKINSLRQHVPEISETFPQKENITIEFIENIHSEIIYNFEFLKIYDIFNNDWLIDIPHLIYSYLKYVFFHKEIYFVHSCLINGNLLIGASGSGKTTLCIEALKENLSVSSLDRTCITFKNKQLLLLAGTDILSVRKEESQPLLSLREISQDRNIYQYDLSVNHQINSVSLFQLSEKTQVKKIIELSITHQLYPFFLDSIKSDCFVQNGKLLFSPIYSEIKKKKLFNHLSCLKIPVFFISGKSKYILFFQNN